MRAAIPELFSAVMYESLRFYKIKLVTDFIFALYIIFHVVLNRFTIGKHERHFELPMQQFCWPLEWF